MHRWYRLGLTLSSVRTKSLFYFIFFSFIFYLHMTHVLQHRLLNIIIRQFRNNSMIHVYYINTGSKVHWPCQFNEVLLTGEKKTEKFSYTLSWILKARRRYFPKLHSSWKFWTLNNFYKFVYRWGFLYIKNLKSKIS